MLLLLLFMYGVSGTDTDESEPVSVMEGDYVTLHTNLSEILNDDMVLWMFGPKKSFISQITRKGDLTPVYFTDDVRFSGRLQMDQKTGSLTIKNTRIKHSGQYKLTIAREKTTTKIFNVTVNGVVGELDGLKLTSVSVTEGESVTLHTDAEMHKDALMLWRFGDKGILLAKIDVETKETSLNDADERFRDRLKLDQTGSLSITNTRITDTGLYQLQIRGSESSQRFLLSVNDPGLSLGAIAGICFGVLVPVLLFMAALIYYCWRISKLKKQIEKEETVTEGKSVTLQTGLTQIQGTDTIQWCYEAEDNLIAEINGGNRRTLPGADGRFISKLILDERNGNLTINNIRTIHSGLYKLKISSGRKNKYKRFIVNVSVRTLPVTEGDPVSLPTGVEIQEGDLMLWTFGPEDHLVVKKELEMTISESFRGRLELDHQTGSLNITNIKKTDSGHFKLQIINTGQATFRRFNVMVNKKRVNESETHPLIEGVQEATSSV
ncbi:uncharacterized protein LOC143735430 [Siphateles boraxobius]|uniref:uncharacterized protein LOC143735430 n=1 Tax=Siphateles boraxobius TaxID=180520 RepID=UPI004064B292